MMNKTTQEKLMCKGVKHLIVTQQELRKGNEQNCETMNDYDKRFSSMVFRSFEGTGIFRQWPLYTYSIELLVLCVCKL